MNTFGTTSTSQLLRCEVPQMSHIFFAHDTHYFYVRVFFLLLYGIRDWTCYSIFHLFSRLLYFVKQTQGVSLMFY